MKNKPLVRLNNTGSLTYYQVLKGLLKSLCIERIKHVFIVHFWRRNSHRPIPREAALHTTGTGFIH